MGKNTGNGHRNGAVKNRTQVYNPSNNLFIKRNTTTGQFISAKSTPYKGIKQENKSK